MAKKVVDFQSNPADADGVVADDDQARIDEIERYLDSDEAKLSIGAPPLLTRKEKQARKGLPATEDLRKLAWVWLRGSHDLYPDLVKAGKRMPHLHGWDDELWKKVRRRAAYVRKHAIGTGKTYKPRDLYARARTRTRSR